MVTRAGRTTSDSRNNNDEMEYDAAVFLSPPRANKKGLGGVLSRRSITDRKASSPSPTSGTPPTRQETKRFSLFSRREPDIAAKNDFNEAEDSDDEIPINLGALLSPRLEQKLTKRKQFSFPSIKTFRSPLQSGGRRAKSLGSLPLFHRGDRHDSSSGDDESDASNEEENDDEDVEKIATSDDLLLLLCRELELMSDGEDE
jgi:hypothetical protein